jgi:outer membrane protein
MTVARWRLTALVAFAAGAPWGEGGRTLAAQQLEVTLGEAVRRALEAQPAVVGARGAASNAGWQKRAAYGAFLPSVTVSSNAFRLNQASIVNGFPTSAGTFQYNSSLTATVDVFAGFRRIARYRNADATQDAADAGLVNERYQTTLATQQAFYAALADEELVRVAEAQVKRAEQQLKISVDKLRAGSATRSDTLRSTVDLGNARLALLQAQADLASAQAALGRQIGVDQPVRAVPDTALPALPDTTALRASALQMAPVVRRTAALARAVSASVWDTRSQYWPTLTATYITSSQGVQEPWTGFRDPAQRNQNQLRFGLTWTLLNGFQRELANSQSAVAADVARAEAADARRGVTAQLTQQLAALFTTYEQIRISRTNVAAATEDLRVVQERYRVGAATILDLLTSQASLTQAEVSLVQARYDYLGARAQLEALVGHAL